MQAHRKKVLIIILIALLVAILWIGSSWYRFFSHPLLKSGPDISIRINKGITITELAAQLQQQNLLSRGDIFVFYAEFKGYDKRLHYGEYWIKSGMTAPELLRNIAQGTGLVYRKMTFIEGWTFEQIKQALNKDIYLTHTITNKSDAEIMKSLGFPEKNPEGLFFPDTYKYTWGNSDAGVLKRAYKRMQKILQKQWADRQPNLPYKDAYQALIVASLIEKETAVASERPLISGVILQRLAQNMRLQIDPTILYGLKKPFSSKITKEDLKSDTPYNTYLHYGLPPTPIGNPGALSIQAAMHPEATKFLYYVASGNGGHIFSASYKEHLAAVDKYRKMALPSSQSPPSFRSSSTGSIYQQRENEKK